MATVNEFNISNWQKLAQTTPVPRWQFTIQIKWTDSEGANQEHNGTYVFPSVLSVVPDDIWRGWVQDMIQRIARYQLGIDPSLDSLRG
jgi:hypothetical protein